MRSIKKFILLIILFIPIELFCEEKKKDLSYYEEFYRTEFNTVRQIDYFVRAIKNDETDFDDTIYNTEVYIYYYRKKDIRTNTWSSPYIKEIKFKVHNNSDYDPQASYYSQIDNITIPFYTEEDKQKAYQLIVQEYLMNKKYEENKELYYENIYQNIISSNNIENIANYIINYSVSGFFNDSAYEEIAKLLTKNNNIILRKLNTIENPYALDPDCIYLASYIKIFQWTGNKTFLAKLNDQELIYIGNVYDITAIDSSIDKVFLKYKGPFEYSSISGINVVAQFDLLYSIDDLYQ